MSNFLVFDLKVIDSPQAGLGVARCLKSLGHIVYGADDTPFVTNSDLFEKTFVIDELRSLNLDNLLKKLIQIKEIYSIEYIVPCYDETVILFSYLKDKLDFIGIKLIAPGLDSIRAFRKDNLSNIFSYVDLTTPETNLVTSLKEADKYANIIGYPIFVKGMTKGAFPASNRYELESAINKISSIWNNGEINCLIQKAIRGKYINVLLAYKNKSIVAYAEMEKIGLDVNGATWFGKITTSRNLFNSCILLLENTNLTNSIIEIETIKSDDGKYYVYEVNLRPPAWIYASALNGLNFFDAFLNVENKTIFNTNEVYFGRETKEFIKDISDISEFSNLQYYTKGAAYKTNNLKYPSELML